MNAEQLERMMSNVLSQGDLTGDQKVMMVQALCDEYREHCHRQYLLDSEYEP